VYKAQHDRVSQSVYMYMYVLRVQLLCGFLKSLNVLTQFYASDNLLPAANAEHNPY